VVAIPRQPESFVESLFGWRAARRRTRAEAARVAGRPVPRGPGALAMVALVLADVFGTVVTCTLITVGAFLWLVPVGFVVAGVSVLAVEFKVMYPVNKRRAAERAAER
jgi:hypothetical protein